MTYAESSQDLPVQVLAVLVLYRISPEASQAFQTLVQSVQQLPEAPVACVVYDNSPEAHPLPENPFACLYHHNPMNGGLVAAYQFALEHAERKGIPWLLLLDQDTALTAAFLREALAASEELEGQREIGAIVPKLVQESIVLSPHWPYGNRSQQSFSDRFGRLEPDVRVYNSGSLLRVEAVRAAGGFPSDFPLDYLDHAVFARLRAEGRGVFLLHASLAHQLESKNTDLPSTLYCSPRLQGMLRSEIRFYRLYGSGRDRLLLLRRRAKLALRMLARLQFRSLAILLRCMVG
jgi:GT2 family glycosyltransferase